MKGMLTTTKRRSGGHVAGDLVQVDVPGPTAATPDVHVRVAPRESSPAQIAQAAADRAAKKAKKK